MGCDQLSDRDGAVVFVCGRGRTARERCSVEGCGKPAVALCDFPLKKRHPQAGCEPAEFFAWSAAEVVAYVADLRSALARAAEKA